MCPDVPTRGQGVLGLPATSQADLERVISSDEQHKSIELTALRLLARREHSVEELRHKLLRRGYAATPVETVVRQLANRRLISDVRFAGALVRTRSARGYGPVRIRAELRRQGI